MPQFVIPIAMVATSVISAVTQPDIPDLPPPPETPSRGDEEVEAARRDALGAAVRRKGLRSTVLAGGEAEEPQVKTKTVLG